MSIELSPTQSLKLFSEDEVRELVAQINNVAEEKIDIAFDEGFKEGVLSKAKENVALEKLNEELQLENEKLSKNRITNYTVATLLGFIAGMITFRLVQ